MTAHVVCGVPVAETGKSCRLEGKPDDSGIFRCHNHRGAARRGEPMDVDAVAEAAALLAQRRVEARVAKDREIEAAQAYIELRHSLPVPTGHAHGRVRQGAVDVESHGAGDR